ncbi:hypothetical protein CR513_59064, partial [Mucuna pruriens]
MVTHQILLGLHHAKSLVTITLIIVVHNIFHASFLSDLSISQDRIGVIMQLKAEWSVTITNKCPC